MFALFLKWCKVRRSCRGRKMQQNAYSLAKLGFDTAENELSKICQHWQNSWTFGNVFAAKVHFSKKMYVSILKCMARAALDSPDRRWGTMVAFLLLLPSAAADPRFYQPGFMAPSYAPWRPRSLRFVARKMTQNDGPKKIFNHGARQLAVVG